VPPVKLDDRVTTADGPGVVIGSHVSETWVFRRLERRAYLLVELDAGGRRLYPITALAPEAPATPRGDEAPLVDAEDVPV
jgi:hypothetical protein